MKAIVCGGRLFADRARLFAALDRLHSGRLGGISLIVHGGAFGADSLAGEWADARGVPQQVFPAEWGRYGAGAGAERNAKMANSGADLLVAFPGGRGTGDMIFQARLRGLAVWDPYATDEPPSGF